MQYLILHFASFHFRLHFKRVSFTTIGFVLVIATFTFWDVMPTQIHPLDGDPIITVHATEEKAPNEIPVSPVKEDAKPKIVLYWNTYYNQTDMTFGLGREPFVNAGCKVSNCVATNDRNLFNQSDGVIFHAGDYRDDDMPTHRFPHQRFIFLLFETLPGAAHLPCFSRRNYYNWTMSHRRDSDIYVGKPYGALRKLGDGTEQVNRLPPKLQTGQRLAKPEELLNRQYPQLANRTKLIAWFNSHCPTHSQREDYVKELAKHIQVDIYGKCGPLECLPRNDPRCDVVLDKYRFYLAAENSLCPDYVTEKFYRALMNDIVPIVIGGADYAQYAPPNSYVNVADFRSPKDLADYLLFISKNDALYNKYFDWKKNYRVVRKPLNGWCDLCQKLNDPTMPSKSYESIARWWYDDVPCYPGSSYISSIQSEQKKT